MRLRYTCTYTLVDCGMRLRYTRTYTLVDWGMRLRYTRTYTLVDWGMRLCYTRTYTLVDWGTRLWYLSQTAVKSCNGFAEFNNYLLLKEDTQTAGLELCKYHRICVSVTWKTDILTAYF